MRLVSSPLIDIALNKKIRIDERIVTGLSQLVESPNTNRLKNLVPIIYYNLKRNGYLRRLPLNLGNRLKEEYYKSILLDMQQRAWLIRFIEKRLLKDSCIILLKGSANWGTIYRPEAPRLSVDIDILVKEEDFERITKIIEGEAHKIALNHKRPFTNIVSYEYAYSIPGLPVTVEIHRRISYPFVGRVNYERFFSDSIMHPYYKDERVRILKPVDRIMHILIHSLKHADITAYDIVDSYLIVKKYKLKMNYILSYAAEFGVRDYAALFFERVSDIVRDESLRGPLKNLNIQSIKRRGFNLLHLQDNVTNFRTRQIMSLIMLDQKIDVLRFLSFYAQLRLKDIILYRFSILNRLLYGK